MFAIAAPATCLPASHRCHLFRRLAPERTLAFLERWTMNSASYLSRAARVLSLSVLMFFISTPLFSQTSTGRILGVVKDQTGGTIAGASVTVTDVARGVSRNLTTD